MTIDEFIEHSIEVAEENRINANSIESNMYIPLSVDKDNLIDNCIKCAEEHEQLAKWLEELKELRELKDTYAKGMETSYSEFRYKQGITDAINAIKNDLRGKLVEEQNKSYADGSLCLGYYNSIKICDWYLNDNKEADAEKEYLLNTYGLTVKIAEAEKQRIRTEAFDEAIAYFEIHAHEVYNHISARDFICDRLEQLKESKNE